ncbi:hypothetical protein [Mucilaginibacter sp. 22184]|uniref:hypothetical protein n=1 Tax=Mucilaginibacter sp. 22184 TaxID=3453887 RepID=UPI003F848DA5
MNRNRKIPDLKGRNFNGTYYPKLKRFRQEPRHKIRQLLRSFIPLNQPEIEVQATQKSVP